VVIFFIDSRLATQILFEHLSGAGFLLSSP